MKSKKEIIKSSAYWLAHLQIELFNQLKKFMERNNLNQNDLAEKFKVTKGHISQILNGDSNFTLKKLISLSLNIGKIPIIKFLSINKYLSNEKKINEFFQELEHPTYEIIMQVNLQKILIERRRFNSENLLFQNSQPNVMNQNSLTIH